MIDTIIEAFLGGTGFGLFLGLWFIPRMVDLAVAVTRRPPRVR